MTLITFVAKRYLLNAADNVILYIFVQPKTVAGSIMKSIMSINHSGENFNLYFHKTENDFTVPHISISVLVAYRCRLYYK